MPSPHLTHLRSLALGVLPYLVGAALLVGALAFLHHELHSYTYAQISANLRALSVWQIALAVGLTVVSYALLTTFDLMATRFAGSTVPYPKVAFASFVAYALSHNLGFSLFTGSAARYRFFSSWGMSPTQIAHSISLSALLFWLVILFLSGVVITGAPSAVFEYIPGIHTHARLIGIVVVAGVFLLVSRCVRSRDTLHIFGFELPSPTPSTLLIGLLVGIVDWAVACGVAYVLLDPPGVSFMYFFGLFLVAQCVGLLSHIPGGLGVVEAVCVGGLGGALPADKIAGTMIAYRLIYYIAPLTLSSIGLLAHEVTGRNPATVAALKRVSRGVSSLMPLLSAVGCFVAGAVLILSGTLPPLYDRQAAVNALVPLPVIEGSYLFASAAGLGLLLVSIGLRRRLDGAFFMALILLVVGMVLSLVKGFDYEEAIVLFLVFLLLLSSRSHFYRTSTLTGAIFTPRWLGWIVIVVAATSTLLVFSFKHVEYAHQLWWEFGFDADTPRALRATMGVFLAAVMLALHSLLRPVRAHYPRPSDTDLRDVAALVQISPRTSSHLALIGDKCIFWNRDRTAFVMFAIEGSFWVAYGDPVGPSEAIPELIWEFCEAADRVGDDAVFYQVRPDNLPSYIDCGFALLKLGNEAMVPLTDFSLEGRSRRGLRQSLNRLYRAGYTFEVIDVSEVPHYLPELRRVSDAWLSQKKAKEKGFSLGYFSEEYLCQNPVAIARIDSRIVAFANIWCGGELDELSVDLMRYDGEDAHGVMDLLFLELMMWGARQGYKTFNLGMAPFSGLELRTNAPFWNRLGHTLFRHGENFYNFQGVLQYKNKFDPRWEPRYLATPSTLKTPLVFASLVSLISRGTKKGGRGDGEMIPAVSRSLTAWLQPRTAPRIQQ